MTRHTPSDSPCDDPAHSQHRLSPAESKIQNQKIDFPPKARLGYVMTRHTTDIPPNSAEFRIQVLAFALCGFCQEFYERGQNSKSTIRKGSLEEMVNGGQNPESRIMRGGWWLRKESRIQSSESGQGCERLCRKEKRIQNSKLEGTLERE